MKLPSNPSYLIHAYLQENKSGLEAILQLEDYSYVQDVLKRRVEDNELREAFAIFIDQPKKVVVNAFLMCRAAVGEIAETLEIKKEIIEKYSRYLFNADAISTVLDRTAYINSIKDESEKDLYLYAIRFGKDFLKWKICGMPLETNNMKRDLQDLFTAAKFKAQVAIMNSITSNESQQALKWALHASKLAETMNKMGYTPVEVEASPESQQQSFQGIIDLLVRVAKDDTVTSISDIDPDNLS